MAFVGVGSAIGGVLGGGALAMTAGHAIGGAALGAGIGELTGAGWKTGALAGGAIGGVGYGAFGLGAGGTSSAIGSGSTSFGQVGANWTAGGLANPTFSLGAGAANTASQSLMGGMGLMDAMTMAGMASTAIGAFGGGSSQASVYQTNIALGPKEKAMTKRADAAAREFRQNAVTGNFYQNMATPVLRSLKQDYGRTKGTLDTAASQRGASANVTRVGSTGANTKANLAGFGTELAAGTRPAFKTAEMQSQNLQNAMGMAGNIENRELQVGMFKNAAQWARLGASQQEKIMQGRALGDIAQMGGMMYFNRKYNA